MHNDYPADVLPNHPFSRQITFPAARSLFFVNCPVVDPELFLQPKLRHDCCRGLGTYQNGVIFSSDLSHWFGGFKTSPKDMHYYVVSHQIELKIDEVNETEKLKRAMIGSCSAVGVKRNNNFFFFSKSLTKPKGCLKTKSSPKKRIDGAKTHLYPLASGDLPRLILSHGYDVSALQNECLIFMEHITTDRCSQ